MRSRVIAFSLDVLLLLTLIGVADFATFSSNEEVYLLKPERLLHLLLGWLYFAGTETCSCQSTLGKYLLHQRVTTTAGQRISFKAATIRYFAKLATPVVLVIQYFTSVPPDTRIPFHDRLAHTQVVLR